MFSGEMTHSLIHTRSLHPPPVLNTVPESLNSPDVAPPKRRQQRDDPLLYHHDMTSSLSAAQAQIRQRSRKEDENTMSKSMFAPNTKKMSDSNNGQVKSEVNSKQSKRQQYNRSLSSPQTLPRTSSGTGTRKSAPPNKQVAELRRTEPTQNVNKSHLNRKRQYQRNNAKLDADESSQSEAEVDTKAQPVRSLRSNTLNRNRGSKPVQHRGYESEDNRVHKKVGQASNLVRSNSTRKSSDGSRYTPDKYVDNKGSSKAAVRPGSAPATGRSLSATTKSRPVVSQAPPKSGTGN